MALTKVRHSIIENEPLNVITFGADPTGVADSTSAFSDAFAEAATSGQAVYMPTGTYLLDEISLTNGNRVSTDPANLNKYGQHLYGDGVGKTILKCSGTEDKFLSFLGSVGNYFYTKFKAEDFSIDMSLMPDAATSIGIYGIYAFGGSVNNVDVKNPPANAFSLYLDQGCYTTVWTNCGFDGEAGRIKLQGVGTQPVTTQTFIGCLWAQMYADNCSSNSVINCIIQGDLTPKFVLSEQYGLTISGSDMEGTGLLYQFGTNCGQVACVNNTLVGFSGTYSTGEIGGGMLLDQKYPVAAAGDNPLIINNQAITTATITNGNNTALQLNGTVAESVEYSGLVRKKIHNTSAGASVTDIEFLNSVGETYVGQDAAGNSYIDGRGTQQVTLNQAGTPRVGVDSTSKLYLNTTTAGAAGALVGYFEVTNGTTTYKIPYYAV
jgi:hypothetical protein